MEEIKETYNFMKHVEKEVHDVIADYDMQPLHEAADLIQKAESKNCRIHVTGIGKPSHLAGYIASLFSSTGTPAYSWQCRASERRGCCYRYQQFRKY